MNVRFVWRRWIISQRPSWRQAGRGGLLRGGSGWGECSRYGLQCHSPFLLPGEETVEETYDRMFTVTSRLRLTVSKEDDGVAVICIIDHPAVKDLQAQKYLEVQCESSLKHNSASSHTTHRLLAVHPYAENCPFLIGSLH